MSFRFRRRERIEDGVRRIALEQIDRALRDLDSDEVGPAEIVHKVRKRTKRLRAVARLVKSGLKDDYATANAHFRDTAKLLASARDAKVRLDTFHSVIEHFGEKVQPENFQVMEDLLTRECDAVADDSACLLERFKKVREQFDRARSLVNDWELETDARKSVAKGLHKATTGARQQMKQANKDPAVDAFHDWRKRVKDHWYHCQLLRNIWRPVMEARTAEVDRLGELLGYDHDLAVLRDHLESHSELADTRQSVAAFTRLIAKRRQQTQRSAFTLGALLFSEKPALVTDRLMTWWKIWRSER